MSNKPSKYLIRDNTLYFSALEIHAILSQLADGVKPYADPNKVLFQSADIFLKIEHDALETISRESHTDD